MSTESGYIVRPPNPGGEVSGLIPISPHQEQQSGRGPQGRRNRRKDKKALPRLAPPPSASEPTKSAADEDAPEDDGHSVDVLA
jgi:hypothetical protein